MSEKVDKKPTKISSLRREMSTFGGARSMIKQARQGSDLIGSGVKILTEATKKTLEPGRFETFDAAMDRLGVRSEELPIIHNQLVLQVYLSFFVGCIALASTGNLAFQGVYLASVVALLIGCAALTKAVQSSMQCYFIRERRLGISSQWWARASDWFPDRIEGCVTMQANDPLRDPRAVNAMVRNARRHFRFGAIVLAPGLLSYFVFGSLGWPLVSMTSAVIFTLLGASLSFEVYKRREGVVCDLYPWLSTPKAWVPKMQPAQPARDAGDASEPSRTKAL